VGASDAASGDVRWLSASMLKRFRSRKNQTPLSLDEEAVVRLAYLAVLRREADVAGLATYRAAQRGGQDLAWLLDVLMRSKEFEALQASIASLAEQKTVPQVEAAHLLSQEPPMSVDPNCSDVELQALWDHVARTWSQLGNDEPHWSVLTQDQFRTEALDAVQLATFYDSGRFEVERLNTWLRRGGLPIRADAVCAEFGCGVGRITHSLARQYSQVIAFDVSAPHLRTADAWMETEGIGNVEFIQVTGKASLAALHDIDVFYSIIALQHSPPPIIVDVLEQAFAALRPGGYAFFQLPTFSTGYSYSAVEHLARLDQGVNAQGGNTSEMEVHFLPQSKVLELAHRAGLRTVEILPDMSVGNLDRWISTAFLLVRD